MSSTALFRTEAEATDRIFEAARPIQLDTSVGPLSLIVTDDVSGLEADWESLQQRAPCAPSQTYCWARAWSRHMLDPEGRKAVIAVGYDVSGRVLFLLPFELIRRLDLKVLTWLGQSHANYNMGLFDPEIAARLSAGDVSAVLAAAAARAGAAAACLRSQPFVFDGLANPFAKLPSQPAPSDGYAVKLGDFAELFRRRFSKNSRRNFERKERKLGELGVLHYGWAESRAERLATIEALFAQKSLQLKQMGVRDIFDARSRAFYRELALLEGDNPSRLHLGYLKIGEQIAATFSGSIFHQRLSIAFSSLAEGEAQKQSPGVLLLRHQIEDACKRGLAFYDIGVGRARHKDQWCDIEQALFDSFIALGPQGYAITLPLAWMARLKGAIKSNPKIWHWAQQLREGLFGSR